MYYPDANDQLSSKYQELSDKHECLFRSNVQALWQEQCFVDVTLACDDKILTAHKLVLSAYSDYFKMIFTSLKHYQHPVVFLKDISFGALQDVLHFIYCGEVNVSHCNLISFMKTAQNLKLKGFNAEGEDVMEKEGPQKKRKSNFQDSIGNNHLRCTSEIKKKKALSPSKEQNNFDGKIDSMHESVDNFWDEDCLSMAADYEDQERYSQQPKSKSLQQRKPRHSFGFHSSQQTEPSFIPILSESTSQDHTLTNSSRNTTPYIKEEAIEVLINDQNSFKIEEIREDYMDDNFSKSSQPCDSETQKAPQVPVESSQEDESPYESMDPNSSQLLIDNNESDLLSSLNSVAHLAAQSIDGHLLGDTTSDSLEKNWIEDSSVCSNLFTSLPSFGDFVQPYLFGEDVPEKLLNNMRNIIIETLIEYLDENNLLTGSSKVHQALGYKALGRTLVLKYPNIHREECTTKRRRKEEMGFLMSRLANRRRMRKRRGKEKERQ